MNSTKKVTRIIGMLFLIQLTAAILSYSVILEPILYSKDFIENVFAHTFQVKLAMLLDVLCGIAIVTISILLYPILKKFSQRIALWYVGLRLVEFTTILISCILLLSLTSVSAEFHQNPGTYLESLGKIMRTTRAHAQNMTIISFCLGAFMFYLLLFRVRLLPRFIPIWGMIAVSLAMTEVVSGYLGYHLPFFIYLPMGLNEIFLGFWLLFKGFKNAEPKSLDVGIIT